VPPVTRLRRSYAALRLPRFRRLRLRSPLAFGLPACGRVFFLRGLSARPRRARARGARLVGDGSPAPRTSGFSAGETRVSQVAGPSSSCVPRPHTPPALGTLARLRVRRCCLQGKALPRHRNVCDFGAGPPRPTRSRAYASPASLPPPSQGSLPAWRATPWPGGFRTRWTTNRILWLPHVSTPFGPALPGRTLSPYPASAPANFARRDCPCAPLLRGSRPKGTSAAPGGSSWRSRSHAWSRSQREERRGDDAEPHCTEGPQVSTDRSRSVPDTLRVAQVRRIARGAPGTRRARCSGRRGLARPRLRAPPPYGDRSPPACAGESGVVCRLRPRELRRRPASLRRAGISRVHPVR